MGATLSGAKPVPTFAKGMRVHTNGKVQTEGPLGREECENPRTPRASRMRENAGNCAS